MSSGILDSRTLSRLDFNLLGTAIVIASLGCVLVYSATWSTSGLDYLERQIVWVAIGIVVMLLLVAIDYHVLLDVALVLYGIGLALLLYLLIWGRATANVHSWIHVGSFRFQPSEFMKIFTALVLAKWFDSNDRAYLDIRALVIVGAIIGAPVALIVLQPDFGTAATYFPLVVAAMFLGGIRPRTWIVALLIVAILSPLVWMFVLHDYQRARVLTYLNPERDPLGKGYQVMQAKIAIGSGGITGKGFLQGTQARLEFLPARHTDFIFAVLGEEWGFIGVAVVLSLYLLLLVESFIIAKAARDRSGTFLVIFLVSFFVFHIFINVAMQIGLLPTTGIPLPLVSYGGSSTLMFFMAVGLIQNVDFRKYVNV